MRYRRRANHIVIVDAIQWDGDLDTFNKIANELDFGPSILTRGAADRQLSAHDEDGADGEPAMVAGVGDWLVTNGAGFVQVLREDEFDAEYEAVPAD